MKFIDSNILAYAFYQNKFQEVCQRIINEGGVINTINLIEAFNIIEFETNRDAATKAVKGFLKSNLVIINADINLVFEALKKAHVYKNLKCIDLIHYATALLNNCESIVSYDADFDGLDIPREEG